MKKDFISTCILFVAMYLSCGKSEEKLDFVTVLTSNKWKITEYTRYDRISGRKTNGLEECQKDDILMFYKTGLMVRNESELACHSNIPYSLDSNHWTYQDNYFNVIKFLPFNDVAKFAITYLSNNEIKFENKYNGFSLIPRYNSAGTVIIKYDTTYFDITYNLKYVKH